MNDIFSTAEPYGLIQNEKRKWLNQELVALTEHHRDQCEFFSHLVDKLADVGYFNDQGIFLPFLPVRLFKTFDLMSVQPEAVVKTMTSSGTSGQQVSKIYLDKETSMAQTKTLVRIMGDFIGNKRLPMLIIDSADVLKDRKKFSARGSGILGFSMIGAKHTYALSSDMVVNVEAIENFLDQYGSEPFMLFGFTAVIWEYLYQYCKKNNLKFDLSNAILIHGGGFKKLLDQAINNDLFKEKLHEHFGIKRVHNYYGMVEQTGSIFVECEAGRLHTSIYSDIIIRDQRTFSEVKDGEVGLVHLVSVLPKSYPGHSLLSEDLGEITGVDDCPCGRLGKTFKIHGRVKQAEIRGCSDAVDRK